MKVWKTMLAAALAAASLLGLTACGGGITNDATVYVQGLLDANYKGQISQEYIDVVEDMTQEQAEADHANNLEMEGDYLLTYLAVEMPTDAVTTSWWRSPSPPLRSCPRSPASSCRRPGTPS